MSFDNKTIRPPNPMKPHICLRFGLWRVSFWNWNGNGQWHKAHKFVGKLNEEKKHGSKATN